MDTQGPTREVTPDDALGIFATLDEPSTPLTTTEVAEAADCDGQAARTTLERLVERGDLRSKETGTDGRIWWRPAAGRDGGDRPASDLEKSAELGDFVTAVEDYAIFALDADGTVATWNQGARRIKGYDESEIVGEHFSTFYTEEDVEEGVPDENIAAARSAGRIEDEGWRVRADGTKFWANVVITAIRDDGGDLQGFTKVTRDMTERREYEQRLQRERNRTEEVLNTAPIPIAVQNAEGETVNANERAGEVLGLAEDEIVEGPDDEEEWTVYDENGEVIDPSEGPAHRVVETGEPVYDEEIAIEDPSGERTWFSINAAPFTGPDGDQEGVVVAGEDVTGLKERQIELETELSEVLGRVSDAFYALDDEWRFTHVNERAADVLQHDEEELLGTSVWEVFPETKGSEVHRTFEEAFDAQESRRFELNVEEIGRWLEFNVYPSETGLSVYFQDVTERKEHERELETYETIVETMNDGIYVKDENGQFTMVNDAYAEITGYDREELVGAHASLVVDEETMAESKELVSGDADTPMEALIETADDETVPAEGTFASLETGEEVGVVRDVTERKERERQLQERERQLSTLMENVPGMVYRCRNERGWPMEFVSEGCRDLTGYDPEAFERGETSYGADVVHEEDREELWEDVQRGLEDDGSFLVTYRVVTPDGSVRWVRERGRSITDERGDLEAIEGVVIDVTDRKRLESELDEVFGRVTDAFFALDEDWEFTYVNEKAHAIVNPEGRTLEGKKIWEAFPDALDRSFQEKYERAMYEQETVTFEEYYPEPLDAWYEMTAYPSETGLSVYFRDVTQRKEVQRRLESERDVFAEGPAVVFRWGTDAQEGWPVEYVSENVEDVLGYAPEELTGEDATYADLLLEEELDRIAGEVESANARMADRFTHEPYRVKTKDGDVRWVKDITSIVRDESGEVEHYLGYLVDVTERKEHERELETYETIVETVNDGIYVVDDEGRFTMVNDAYAEMVGYDREDLLGEHVSLVVDEDVGRQARELEAKLAAGEVEEATLEAELQTASGERVPSEATFAVLSGDDADKHRVGVARDVTDRREYERELERKERRYEAVFEDPNILVGLLEPDGTVLDINDTAMEYIDVELEDVVGEQFSETPWWMDDDGIQSDVREWVERAAAGEYVDFEADLERPNGERYVLSGYFRPVTNDDGDVVSIIVSDRDITEQKEYQRELERSEQRYRTVVENFPNGAVGLVDEDLRYQTVGGRPVDKGSEGPSDLEGKTIREALDSEFADAVEPRYRAALEGESSTFEVEQDGRVAQVQTYPVRNDDGEVFAALGMSQDVTERVERERYLEDAKSRFEAATEAGAVGTWEWDVREDEIVANPSFAETFGLGEDEVTEGISLDRLLSRVHEEDRERVRRTIEDTLEARGEYESEYRVWDADDELRWVVARGHVECDEDGTPITFPGAVADITQRKKYQRRIEESEHRYRTLVEHFPDGAVGLFDEELRYTAVGGQFLDQVGVSAEERLGEKVSDIYPEELVQEVEPYFHAALDGEANSFEAEYHDRHLLAHTLPVTDADDEVIAGMLVVQDVSERREAQRELRESEAKFRMIAENLQEIVWMATPDAEEFVYLNPVFEDVWGIDRQELYDDQLSFLEAVHPEDRDRVRENFSALPEQTFDDEFRIVRPDGELRWVHARGARVYDEDGEMARIVGIGEDVTERVEREQRLEELVDQLEESNERLERFAYVASHDLQEPLRMISNYLQLLDRRYRDELDEDAEEFIDFAVDGAERMRDMIGDLLDYSRLDSEAEPFEPTDCDVVVENVLEDLQLRIEETDTEITVGDLPTVEADENQVEMVFQNLLSNAIKYSGDEPPVVEIGADRSDGEWVFHVADEGIGMDPEHTDDVFDVFNRLHSHEEYAGTGIGLAMCAKIVEHHGGRIWVESEPGEGSTFYFTVPVDGAAGPRTTGQSEDQRMRDGNSLPHDDGGIDDE